MVFAPAIERLLKNVKSKDVTVKRHPDAMHDLMLSPEEPLVSQDIIDWITAHS